MIDVEHHINETEREVGERVVTIRRSYASPLEDLWSACTDAERLPRWFLPVSGDLRPGGRYQLEGNAGGTIERCDPPHGFAATWEYGGKVSRIELRLTPESDDRTTFELKHVMGADDEAQWLEYGPGAVGIGWDLGLMGLTLHLASGGEPVDREAFMAWSTSDEAREFMTRSSDAWRDAAVAAGAERAAAEAAATRTTAFYTGAPAA